MPFLIISDAASKKIASYEATLPEARGKLFRIAVRAGGCSGYSYDYRFDVRRDDDIEIPAGTTIVLVDPKSMSFLKGCTVDYMENLEGSSFKIINPNATGSCGCGTSFSV